MARKKSITKRRRGLFLDKLQASGSVTQASLAGEIGRSSWYDLKKRDKDFSLAWDDAEAIFMGKVQAEAVRRAVVGVDLQMPFTNVSKDGSKETKFRTINTKSDRLLELILKARHPLYRPVKAVELSSPDGSMTPAQTVAPDFSGLTNEEVRTVTQLLRKAHAAGAA